MPSDNGVAGAAESGRQPHAALDRTSRLAKAAKMINLIGGGRVSSARRILETGCGSGVIASAIARSGSQDLEMHAVDVVDLRVDKDGYDFRLVDGTILPYADGRFDIVISNHVIEHVGEAADQLRHLQEIKRVLADDGVVYLAVPNRWRLVEPHFRLPFLSWLPHPASDKYVRLTRRGTRYDCNPPDHARALELFAAAGLKTRDLTLNAARETLATESGAAVARAFERLVPGFVRALLMPLMPTYVFLLSK